MIERRFVLHTSSRPDAGASSHKVACPRCGSPVFRVSRRVVDMVVSLFIPSRRFRCISMKCTWEGTLREKQIRLPRCGRSDLFQE